MSKKKNHKLKDLCLRSNNEIQKWVEHVQSSHKSCKSRDLCNHKEVIHLLRSAQKRIQSILLLSEKSFELQKSIVE